MSKYLGDLRGQYLYNMNTGETIGHRTKTNGYNAYTDEEDGGNYSGKQVLVETSSNRFSLLQDVVTNTDISQIQYCTVENLSFPQIMQLFLGGNMVADELKIGLEAKGATDINISENGDKTVAKFSLGGIEYTLQCSTDAASSQIDDVTSDINQDSVNKESHFTPSTLEEDYLCYEAEHSGWVFPKDSDVFDSKYGAEYPMSPEYSYEIDVIIPLLNSYFGTNITCPWGAGGGISVLTKEQMAFVNDNPDKFGGLFFYTAGSNPDGSGAGVTYSISGNDNGEGFEAYLESKGGRRLTVDEIYSKKVTDWGKYLDDSDKYKDFPAYCVKSDGKNIEFTDKTVATIKKYLDNYSEKTPDDYMKLFGFEVGDDEATIWKKINNFCKASGSNDDKTVSLEYYYNVTAATERGRYTYESVLNDPIYNPSSLGHTQSQIDEYREYMKQRYRNLAGMDQDTKYDFAPVDKDAYNTNVANVSKLYGISASQFNGTKSVSNNVKNTYKNTDYSTGGVSVSEGTEDDKVKEFLDNVKEKYPELYEKYFFSESMFIPENEFLLCLGDIQDGVLTPDLINSDGFHAHQGLYRAMWLAAGIKNDDTSANMRDKITNLFSKIGVTNNSGYFYLTKTQQIDLWNYLLGDNSAKENYFGAVNSFDYKLDHQSDIEVQNAEQLQKAMQSGVKNITITADIDLSNSNWQTIENFSGTIRMGGYVSGEYNNWYSYKLTLGDTPFIKNANGATFKDVYLSENTENFVINNSNSTFNSCHTDTVVYIPPESTTNPTTATVSQVKYTPRETAETSNQTSGSLNGDADIQEYMRQTLDEIYAKYFKMTKSRDGGLFEGFHSNSAPMAGYDEDRFRYYYNICWDENNPNREAFIQDMKAAANMLLEKYSDIITSVTFNGLELIVTTIDDDIEKGNNRTHLSGFIHSYLETQGAGSYPLFDIEPACDELILFTKAPDVLEQNIPTDPPVNSDGKTVLKTNWDGIYVTTDSSVLYVWDAKRRSYLEISQEDFNSVYYNANGGSHHLDADALCRGDESAIYSKRCKDEYLNLVIFSLVSGYNRTSAETIFEKDGKYYQAKSKNVFNTSMVGDNIAGATRCLKELTIENNTVTTNKVNKNNNQTSDQTPEKIQVETPEQTKEETPEQTSIFKTTKFDSIFKEEAIKDTINKVILKFKDVISEMQTAAEKLNLTAAKTTGTYYQFSANGSYLHVWNPEIKKFKAFSINTRNADGTINQEFTQSGKAVNRTDVNIYYEALLEAYKNGYNFTANYPWVCEKDGVYYEYDKEAGCFKKRAD